MAEEVEEEEKEEKEEEEGEGCVPTAGDSATTDGVLLLPFLFLISVGVPPSGDW